MTSRRPNDLDARRTKYLKALDTITSTTKRNGRSTGGTLQPPATRFWHLVRTYRAIAAASQKTFDVAATLANRQGDSSDHVRAGVIFLAEKHPNKTASNKSFGKALNALIPHYPDEIFTLLNTLVEDDRNAAKLAANISMGPVFISLIKHGDAKSVEELFIDIVKRNLIASILNPQTPWVLASLANAKLHSATYAIIGFIDSEEYLKTLVEGNNHWRKAVFAVGRSLGLKTTGSQDAQDLADLFREAGHALKHSATEPKGAQR